MRRSALRVGGLVLVAALLAAPRSGHALGLPSTAESNRTWAVLFGIGGAVGAIVGGVMVGLSLNDPDARFAGLTSELRYREEEREVNGMRAGGVVGLVLGVPLAVLCAAAVFSSEGRPAERRTERSSGPPQRVATPPSRVVLTPVLGAGSAGLRVTF